MYKILSGKYKGYPLGAPVNKSITAKYGTKYTTRPTHCLVKKAIFDILTYSFFCFQNVNVSPRCLDLCCGCGNMGFESLSRGAHHVTFVDKNKNCINIAKHTSYKLKIEEEIIFICNDYLRFISIKHNPYDVIFFDPPYGTTDISLVLSRINTSHLIHANSILVYEEGRRYIKESNIEDCIACHSCHIMKKKYHSDTVVFFIAIQRQRINSSNK